MQRPRKRLPAELQYDLTAFLDLYEQRKQLPLCSRMNNLLKTRVGENLRKMKAFGTYFDARIRGALPPELLDRNPFCCLLILILISDDPYQRTREFRVLERKAAELFGPKGERVQNKSLTEPIYDDFLSKEFPSLKHKLFSVMDELLGESSQYAGDKTSTSSLPDPRGYNFDAVFPKWMSQFSADLNALKALCAELDERRRWEIEMKKPAYPCDIHPGGKPIRIRRGSAKRFHRLCRDCLKNVEDIKGHGPQHQQHQ